MKKYIILLISSLMLISCSKNMKSEENTNNIKLSAGDSLVNKSQNNVNFTPLEVVKPSEVQGLIPKSWVELLSGESSNFGISKMTMKNGSIWLCLSDFTDKAHIVIRECDQINPPNKDISSDAK